MTDLPERALIINPDNQSRPVRNQDFQPWCYPTKMACLRSRLARVVGVMIKAPERLENRLGL